MNHTLAKVLASICIQFARSIQVLGEMRLLKLGVAGLAHIIARKSPIRRHGATQQSSAERSISECGDAVAKRERQNIAFCFALEEIVRRLDGVQWRNSLETRHI